MEKIDSILIINIEHRTDRLGRCMNWLHESGVPEEKIHRVDALYTPGRGHIGCMASHIRALETFLQSGNQIGLILEDDFEPFDIPSFWSNYAKLFASGLTFDAVCASYNAEKVEDAPTEAPFLRRLRDTMTASAYLITHDYAKVIHRCFLEAFYLTQFEESYTQRKTHQYMHDVYWHNLMKTDRWYCFYPRIGYQVESFSDIQGHVTNYGV
jgi:hypothetical protein